MEKRDSARLTKREGRRFASTLALAFAVIAAIAAWKGGARVASVLAIVSAIFLIAGAAAPTRLGGVERAWMGVGRAISNVTTPVFMGVVYFLVLTPTALLRRAFTRKRLSPEHSSKTYWVDRPRVDRDAMRRRMERQF